MSNKKRNKLPKGSEAGKRGVSPAPLPCLFDGCHAQGSIRGLCSTHYMAAMRAVHDGKVTWLKLEKAGKALPRKKKPTRAWFTEPAKKKGGVA